MPMSLSNRALEFRLHEQSNAWSVQSEHNGRPMTLAARTSVRWRVGRTSSSAPSERAGPSAVRQAMIQTPFGAAPGVEAVSQAAGSGLTETVEWGVIEDPPALVWRVRVEAAPALEAHLTAVDLLRGLEGATALAGLVGLDEPAAFITGWQSFGFAGSLGRNDRYPRTRLGPILRPSREPPGRLAPRAAGRMASEMWTVVGDRARRVGWLVGVLSEQSAFSSLDIDLRRSPVGLRLWSHGDDIPLGTGQAFVSDWAYLQPIDIDDPDPMGPYLEAAARVGLEGRTPRAGESLSGWCSWYRWFSRVDEEAALENLTWLHDRRRDLPLDMFLIDDGYERALGDWDSPWPKFPRGLPDLAHRIRQEGMKPGLWIAPLAAAPSSELARDHPDWILRDESGRPTRMGLVGNLFPWVLDPTHPQVLAHLEGLAHTAVREWGFHVLKLDFLYAAALQGRRHDPSLTRAQALRRALARLRAGAGDAWIIGCGCPLGPAIGWVDSLRVSPDVAPHWHPHFRGVQLVMHREATVPAARNSLRNAVNLSPLHRRWWLNDPDCVLLHPHPSGWADAAPSPRSRHPHPAQAWARLSPSLGLLSHEVQTVLTLNFLTGGSVIDSDHLPELNDAQQAWLARALPPVVGRARAVDWFDRPYPTTIALELEGAIGHWWLVAWVNWGERPAAIQANLHGAGLPPKALYGIDVWGGRHLSVEGETVASPVLLPHGVFLASLRPVTAGPAWVGDTFDLTAGRAVTGYEVGPGRVRFRLELPRRASGKAWIAVPATPDKILADGQPIAWADEGHGIYGFAHTWRLSTEVVVEWSAEKETMRESASFGGWGG